MRLGRMLRSRFVVVPLVLAAAVGGWNLYVAQHDNGRLAGRVVDASGQPVATATVRLYEQQFTNQVERERTRTDGEGWFHFFGNRSHLVQVQAETDDGRGSPRETVRLWFRAQDRTLVRPLVVRRAAG